MAENTLLRLTGLAMGVGLGTRWLRVAQREHYIPGRCSWLWWLWLKTSRSEAAVAGGAGAGILWGSGASHNAVLGASAILGAATPVRLPHRGRTSKLAWTPRLRRTAAAGVALQVPLVLLAPLPLAATLVAAPFLAVDAALFVLRPLEKRLGHRFLRQAQDKLHSVGPEVVAITGSYGKTTTKQYLAHLLQGLRIVVPSPASFNNAMGLSRAVNEHLLPGTEVFIAEMGTYGPGEIRELCELFPPNVSVITAIGEVHLERMRSQDRILAAKAEIAELARTVVLNVDDQRLARLADELQDQGKSVLRVGTGGPARDVQLVPHVEAGATAVVVHGQELGRVRMPVSVQISNAACAMGAAIALGADPVRLVARLSSLPSVAHRLEPQATEDGGWVLDDTYNSNPVGARLALQRARDLATATGGAVHLVTPGMVELGAVQSSRNADLARDAVESGVKSLVLVGRTNRRALAKGASAVGGERVLWSSPNLSAAVTVVSHLRAPGDVVLFENDLPDHYP